MTNKAKLAFDLLEQEMEVFSREEQRAVLGGTGVVTWGQMLDAIKTGNFSQIPQGSYLTGENGELTIWGGTLNEVVVTRNSDSMWEWMRSATADSGYFGFGITSGGYYNGYGGYQTGGYYGGGDTGGTGINILNYDWSAYSQWNLEAVSVLFHNMGDSVTNFGIVLSATGVGSPVGVPLMGFGGVISLIGTGIDLAVDMRDNTLQSFDYGAWAITVGLEANSIVFGQFTTTTGEKIVFELSQNGIEYISADAP